MHGLGQHRLVGHHGLLGQALELARDLGQGHFGVSCGHRQRLRLFDQPRLNRRRCSGTRLGQCAELRCPVTTATHHRTQQAAASVESKQRFGHRRLHAEHVDQETERAEIAGQPLDGRGIESLGGRSCSHECIDVVAHAHHRLRRVVQPEHGEDPAHRVQLRRHRAQHVARRRLAEVGIDGLLGFGQGTAQLLHHAAHRLAVGYPPIQLLHPGLEHLGFGAALHRSHALGQAAHAVGLGRVVELGILDRGFQIKHGRGHFHGQGGRRRRAGRHRLTRHSGERLGQGVAAGEEALDGIADQLELLAQRRETVQFGAGHGRPALLGCIDALLRLNHPSRVEAAKLGREVINGRPARQAPGQAHGSQARCAAAITRRLGLGTEEEQILRQALRDRTGLLGIATR